MTIVFAAIGAAALSQSTNITAQIPPDLAIASTIFKTGWQARYTNNYAVSRMVLSHIRIGMTTNQVLELLGGPDQASDRYWSYDLFYSMNINVTFGEEGTVTKITCPLLHGSKKAEPQRGAEPSSAGAAEGRSR